MKKTISALLLGVFMLTALFSAVGCYAKKTTAEKIAAGETLKIGILQYMSHPSLDNCYSGIKSALEASGIPMEIDRQVGAASGADNDCVNAAKNMVSEGCDLIFAIATPAAKIAYTATADTAIPVIFCAVSDPVAAGLVESLTLPGTPCTGSADVLDLEGQLAMICALQPDVKNIGVLYTASEDNSLSNLALFRTLCQERGISLIAKAIQNPTEIPAAAADLAARVDCINNFTDNTVVNNLSLILTAAQANHIPVYGSEVEQVVRGCLGAVSIDYTELGKITGEMGIAVLRGSDPAAMPVKSITNALPVFHAAILAEYGIPLPEAYADCQIIDTATSESEKGGQ